MGGEIEDMDLKKQYAESDPAQYQINREIFVIKKKLQLCSF